MDDGNKLLNNKDKVVSGYLKKSQSGDSNNLKVFIRIRPPLPREVEDGIPFRSIANVSDENKVCSLAEYMGAEFSELERQKELDTNPTLFQLHRFTFDYVFNLKSTQEDIYKNCAKSTVVSMLEGYNSTIFAYGQTGTGKTYTMEGFTFNSKDQARGIIPRSIDEIFNYIQNLSNSGIKFLVRASYLQIYNESISDLLKTEKSNLQIREDTKKGVFVEGLSEWAVRCPADIYTLLQKGSSCRNKSSTKMNDVSSRSHAVFVITVEQLLITNEENHIKIGKLNLVDLAGSERTRVTGAVGKQLEESKKINKSLSALGNVINALADKEIKGRLHIPYRDSKLTRLLEDSLGGNCKTTMIAMISPSQDSFNESLSTLHFAKRAKNIKNRPFINEDIDQKAVLRQYEIELKKLRQDLEEKNRIVHSNELIMQLEEEKKQAEDDKQLAIDALEQASRKYLQEREEKKKMEAKINMMNSQVIMGGHKIEDLPQFKDALNEKYSKFLKEFDIKLQDFEKEREQLEVDKSQVEKYKQLLMKERDIMVSLTNKINEKEDEIIRLKEEIDAYDRICTEQEEAFNSKRQRVELLEGILRSSHIKFPEEEEPEQHFDTFDKKRVYIPYQMETHQDEYENSPLSIMNPEQKIEELNEIIKEKEKEIDVLKTINSRMACKSSKNRESKESLAVSETVKNKQANVTQEELKKLSQLEKEIERLNETLSEKEEIISKVKKEFDKIVLFESRNAENSAEKKSKIFKIKDDFLKLIGKVNEDSFGDLNKEMIKIYNLIVGLTEEKFNKTVKSPIKDFEAIISSIKKTKKVVKDESIFLSKPGTGAGTGTSSNNSSNIFHSINSGNNSNSKEEDIFNDKDKGRPKENADTTYSASIGVHPQNKYKSSQALSFVTTTNNANSGSSSLSFSLNFKNKQTGQVNDSKVMRSPKRKTSQELSFILQQSETKSNAVNSNLMDSSISSRMSGLSKFLK